MSMNLTGSALHHVQQQHPSHGTPPSNVPQQSGLNQMNQPPSNHRQPTMQSMPPTSSQLSSQMSSQMSQMPPSSYSMGSQGSNYPPPGTQPQWFGHPIAAPQASHPVVPPPPAHPQPQRSPSIPPDQWDEMYLSVLHTQDTNKLRELLATTDPDMIMPLNGNSLVSQAVILTLVHRVSIDVVIDVIFTDSICLAGLDCRRDQRDRRDFQNIPLVVAETSGYIAS